MSTENPKKNPEISLKVFTCEVCGNVGVPIKGKCNGNESVNEGGCLPNMNATSPDAPIFHKKRNDGYSDR